MADLLNVAMLICASLASLAFGVFSAYGLLKIGFAVIRPRARSAVKPQPEMARIS